MENSEFSQITNADSFCRVVEQMHTSKDPDDIESYAKMIADLGKSKEAWMITKDILGSDNYQEKVYFSAARIMSSKIQYDLVELRQDEYEQLFEFLLGILVSFKD